MVDKNIYLFIGEDSLSKNRKIDSLKKENLVDKSQDFDTFATRKPQLGKRDSAGSLSINPEQTHSFDSRSVEWVDYTHFHADSLSPQLLKEIINSLPVISKKRIVVIKGIEKLSLPNKRLLINFAKNPAKTTILILDTDKSETKDAFVQEISRFSKTFSFATRQNLNVFDLGRMIAYKKNKEALLCLSQLLKSGEKQGNILGVIAWQWKKLRPRMREEEFISGLKLLQQADLSIKRSRLKADFALELLVVKLCSPASC